MVDKIFIKQLNRLGIDLNKCSREEAIRIINEKIEEEQQKLAEANKKLTEIYQKEIKKR
ncbi:MAG: hypothetical protein ABSF20_01275 [Smithella sp.]|jgi:hypothetical protein